MKTLIGLIILAVLAVGLAIALFTTKQRAEQVKQQDVETILYHSNQWETTRAELGAKLEEHKQVIQSLEADVQARQQQVNQLTNRLTDVASTLSRTESSLKAAQEEIATRNTRIAELENHNATLDQQALELSTAITNLTVQIGETQRQLASAQGDKAFLEQELQRLLEEKAELERQFNDLAILREQVAKLKEELSIARRLDWIRRGLFAPTEQKGAQLLMRPPTPAKPAPSPYTYDLNVEIGADGSLRLIPPLTNPPSASP